MTPLGSGSTSGVLEAVVATRSAQITATVVAKGRVRPQAAMKIYENLVSE